MSRAIERLAKAVADLSNATRTKPAAPIDPRDLATAILEVHDRVREIEADLACRFRVGEDEER